MKVAREIKRSSATNKLEDKNLSCVLGYDRKICLEDRRLASQGLPSDDKL